MSWFMWRSAHGLAKATKSVSSDLSRREPDNSR